MPNYSLKNFKTGEIKDLFLSIKEMEEFTKDSDWEVILKPIGMRDNFVASRYSNIPLNNNLKGIYDNIKKNHHGNTMDY